jgi:hypothetical protein
MHIKRIVVVSLALCVLLLCTANWGHAQQPLSATTSTLTDMWAGPGREHDILRLLPASTRVLLDARSASAEWLLARTELNAQGWLPASALELDDAAIFQTLTVSAALISPVSDNDPSGLGRHMARFTPDMREAMLKVARQGAARGLRRDTFTTVGDCHVGDDWFFEFFKDGRGYQLGQYTYLQAAIDYFTADSFMTRSKAQSGGFNSGNIFDPMFAAADVCNGGETPLDCEFRLSRPAVALVQIGLMDATYGFSAHRFADNLNRLVDVALAEGIIPILSTTPETPERFAHAITINNTVRRVAAERSVPLIDLAAAIRPLPRHGLTRNGKHLSPGDDFRTPNFSALRDGFTVWNYLALHALYDVIPVLEMAYGADQP